MRTLVTQSSSWPLFHRMHSGQHGVVRSALKSYLSPLLPRHGLSIHTSGSSSGYQHMVFYPNELYPLPLRTWPYPLFLLSKSYLPHQELTCKPSLLWFFTVLLCNHCFTWPHDQRLTHPPQEGLSQLQPKANCIVHIHACTQREKLFPGFTRKCWH